MLPKNRLIHFYLKVKFFIVAPKVSIAWAVLIKQIFFKETSFSCIFKGTSVTRWINYLAFYYNENLRKSVTFLSKYDKNVVKYKIK